MAEPKTVEPTNQTYLWPDFSVREYPPGQTPKGAEIAAKRKAEHPDRPQGLLPLPPRDEEGYRDWDQPPTEWLMPQWMLDTKNAVTLPSDIINGYQPTDGDVANFAMSVGGGGMASSAITNPVADVGMFLGLSLIHI